MEIGLGLGITRMLQGSGAAQAYWQKVLTIQPANLIGFWRLNETSGAVAVDSSPEANDGAYTGVDLANAAGPDGVLCPYFDGTNDYVNVDSAGLGGDFNDAEITIAVWAKPFNWNDSANRQIIEFASSTGQRLTIAKVAANDTMEWRWFTGGNLGLAGITNATNAWMHFAITRSEAANEVKLWVSGAQVSTTQAAAAATGADWLKAVIGAFSTAPASVWNGWISNVALWNTSLTPAQILELATV